MLLADRLRKNKILTEEMLNEITSELSPIMVTRTSATPAVTQITSFDGLRTSHYMLEDLLDDTYKALIDALPADTNVPVGKVYSLTYTSEQGTAPDAKTVQAATGEKYALVADDLPELTAEDYTFGGWLLNGKAAKVGDIITTNAELAAVWYADLEITYAVGPDSLTPDGVPSNGAVAQRSEGGYVLTAEDLPTLTVEGYTFNGWFIGENEAKVGDIITSDVTITAKFTENV